MWFLRRPLRETFCILRLPALKCPSHNYSTGRTNPVGIWTKNLIFVWQRHSHVMISAVNPAKAASSHCLFSAAGSPCFFFFLFAWLIQSPGLSYILYDIMYLFNQHVSSSSACCAHLHKSVLMCWTVGFSSAAGSREGSIFICKNSCWHQTNDPTAAKISQSLLYKTNFI